MAETPSWLSQYPEVENESWLDQYPEAKEKPFLDISETASALGRAATSLATTVPSSLSQAWSGLDNPWKRSEGYLQSQQGMRDLQEELAQSEREAELSGDASTVSSTIREAIPSLGFSGATLLPSLGAGAGTLALTRSPNAARGAAAATSAIMAYRMAGAQFLDDAKERIDAYFQENLGRLPNEQEQNEAYDELLPLARKFGAAEAGPEAIGNLALGGAGKYIRRALGGKGGVMELASNALGKVTGTKAALAGAGALASEIGTEAVTAVEQDRVNKQFEEGVMRGESPESVQLADRSLQDYVEGFKEVAPTTTALTAMMGAAGLAPTAISRGIRSLRKPQVEAIETVEEQMPPPPVDPGIQAARDLVTPTANVEGAQANAELAKKQIDESDELAKTAVAAIEGMSPPPTEPAVQPEQKAKAVEAPDMTGLSDLGKTEGDLVGDFGLELRGIQQEARQPAETLFELPPPQKRNLGQLRDAVIRQMDETQALVESGDVSSLTPEYDRLLNKYRRLETLLGKIEAKMLPPSLPETGMLPVVDQGAPAVTPVRAATIQPITPQENALPIEISNESLLREERPEMELPGVGEQDSQPEEVAAEGREEEVITPQGTPTPATEGTPTSRDVGKRDATKPEQMTREEHLNAWNQLNIDAQKAREKANAAKAKLLPKNPASKIRQMEKNAKLEQEAITLENLRDEFPPTPSSAIENAVKEGKPFSVDLHKASGYAYIPSGYTRQGDLYVFQPGATGEPVQAAPPAAQAATATAPGPIPQTTAAEKQTPAPSRKGAGAAGVTERQPSGGSIPEVTPSKTPETQPSTKESKAAAKEDRDREAEEIKDGQKVRRARKSVIDPAKTNIEYDKVTTAIVEAARRQLQNSGEIPNAILTRIYASPEAFLADRSNQRYFPVAYASLMAEPNVEGLYADKTTFVFASNVGVSDLDRNIAEARGISEEQAAARRVIAHENGHRGVDLFEPWELREFRSFVNRTYTTEEIDNLVRLYTEFADWRTNPVSRNEALEEIFQKKFERLVKIPTGGLWDDIVQFLKRVWRRLTGRKGDPTLQDMKDVVRLLRNAMRRTAVPSFTTKDGGEVKLSLSDRFQGVTPAQDAEYLAAVEAGDMEKAQRMVDEAANATLGFPRDAKTGEPVKVQHDTPAVFTEFKPGGDDPSRSGRAIWLGVWESSLKAGHRVGNRSNPKNRTLRLYADLKRPLILDSEEMVDFARAAFMEGESDFKKREFPLLISDEVLGRIKADGYDGIIFDTAEDRAEMQRRIDEHVRQAKRLGLSEKTDQRVFDKVEIIAFSPNQIKSADPVTYDDAGNVIPLSQRFQAASPDIRFSRVEYASDYSAASSAGAQLARDTIYDDRIIEMRDAIRRAYEQSSTEAGVAMPIDELYAKAKELAPEMTENEFSNILQDLYEDNGAVLQEGDIRSTLTEEDRRYLDLAEDEEGNQEELQAMVDGVAGKFPNMEEVSPSDFSYSDEDDGFFYHVTDKERLEQIVYNGQGLVPGMTGQFSGAAAQSNSRGKVFFTEKSGVKVWMNEVERQLENSREYDEDANVEDDIAVIRIPKNLVQNKQDDDPRNSPVKVGRDFFSTQAIPAYPPLVVRDNTGNIIPLSKRFGDAPKTSGQINVFTPEGRRAGFVVVMPKRAVASRVETEGEAVDEYKKKIEAINSNSLNAFFDGRQVKGASPQVRTVKSSKSYEQAAIELVNDLTKDRTPIEDIAESLFSEEFLQGLGIKLDIPALVSLIAEVKNRVSNQSRDDKVPGARRIKLQKLDRKLAGYWQDLGTNSGRSQGIRSYITRNPRYSWMFIFDRANENLEKEGKLAATRVASDLPQTADNLQKTDVKAGEDAGEQVADDLEEDQYQYLLKEGEENLSSRRKEIWERAKMILRRLAMYVRRKSAKTANAKASLSEEQRKELDELNAIMQMSDEEATEAESKDLAEFDALMAEFFGLEPAAKTTEQKATRKKREKMVATAKKRAEQGKSIEPSQSSAKEKLSGAERTAQNILKDLSERYADPNIYTDAKRAKINEMRELYKKRVRQGVGPEQMSEQDFVSKAVSLGANKLTAETLWKAAEMEIDAREAMRQEEVLGKLTLEKIQREISALRPGEQAPFSKTIPWRKLLSQKAATVKIYRQRIFDTISSEESFSDLDDAQKAKLADLLTKAWESKREAILDRMVKNVINQEEAAGRLTREGADALRSQRQKLVEDINLGILDEDRLMKHLAEKFGIKSEFTEAERANIDRLLDILQDDKLNEVKRNKAGYELLEALSSATKIPFAKLLADYWVSSVLSGLNTAASIAMAVANGGFELTVGLFRVLRAGFTNPKEVPAEIEASFKAMYEFLKAFGREGRLAWQYLVTGDRALLDPSLHNVRNDLNYDSIGKTVSLAERMAKSDKVLEKVMGIWMRSVSRLLTALDNFNTGVTKAGALPIVFRQLNLSGEDLQRATEKYNLKLYREKAIREDFDNKQPTNQHEKALVDSYAKARMMADLQEFGQFSENADFIAQNGAMTLDPTGVGGAIYSGIKYFTGGATTKADKFLADAQREWNQVDGADKTAKGLQLAFAYIRQFIAYNSANLAGLRFARFAGNKFNQGLSFIPGIGMLRMYEATAKDSKIEAKEAFTDMIMRNQTAGLLLSLAGFAVIQAITDEPDDEKRGWFINGGWANLTPDSKQQKLAAGQKEYTIGIPGVIAFNYQNWPISPILAAIGSLSDLVRYSREQWNEKSIADRLVSAAASGVFSAGEIPALSGFQTLFGNNLSSKDPNEKRLDRFAKVMAGWGGGFVPRILKDVDFMTDPGLRKYESLWEQTASHIPVYRRHIGEEYYDILGKQIERKVWPGSREFMELETDPEYRTLGKLNSRGIWLTPANAEHRMVGKGRFKRKLTQEEADAYSLETGKGYRQMLLRYGSRLEQMPTERARAFLMDKADEVRDRALQKITR